MGSDETLLVNYCQMYPSKLAAICGAKIPNAWGLHDVHGNVVEWCEDMHEAEGMYRMNRGGSWNSDAEYSRSAYRNPYHPADRRELIGFRVALSPSVKQPEAER